MIQKISTKVIKANNWSIEIFNDWQHEYEDGIWTFVDPKSSGVLQISAFVKDKEIAKEDVIDLLEDKVKMKKVLFGDFKGFEYDELINKVYWRKIILYCNSLLLYITYNSELYLNKIENSNVNATLNTIKIR